ncbi:3-oxo-5-alpha-steroid 4-dehydrogenase family protein [Trichomonas vaginalis G3]|uniref:3-oxo-5-alpha-steroid 4-dehydrogenase family protein n=1 Tax=Trichomonas vaginalis (strain ATCC PRA-98 / G3) TaxID=412133 RepID=A2F2T2_TRIV3|nr:very-long-chain enoyl-CoA reductase protein [Trichomonas vaginalis G3]EAY00792.1 3-oxo-5-alpha-steroid 4-dehydrogenase family protein [Trichomonas vaginalis G3]KAI5518640.1 very-long-chain enoyl-CoA reductase protein [Trichomonas vaginalis G3]|eukprot:XP_001313721.1 3-oxo-5-alpha-steroid 4-dehydrogenase family protein [Trichomonas vaginalis G3]
MKIQLRYQFNTFDVDVPEEALGALLFDKAVKETNIIRKQVRIVYNKNGENVPIAENTKIKDVGATTFIIKDMGPQIGWRTSFLLEYCGPFVICPLLLLILRNKLVWNSYFTIGIIMWELHYAKRIYESIWVHTFSHATMPLADSMRNVVYYWTFTILVNYNLYDKSLSVKGLHLYQILAIPCWFVCECLNLYCHIGLANLRPKGSKEHYLPKGFLFDQIACPNYTFEISGWIFFSIYSGLLISFFFTICGGTTMFIWAEKKRNNLIKKWPEAKNRGRISPFTFF